MTTRPRIITSIPFWLLIAASLASGITGALLLADKLAVMTSTLTEGTATGVEVYVGQIWAVLGAILIGAGIVGLALALTVGALRSLVPSTAVEIVEPVFLESDDAAAFPPAPVTAEPLATAGAETPLR